MNIKKVNLQFIENLTHFELTNDGDDIIGLNMSIYEVVSTNEEKGETDLKEMSNQETFLNLDEAKQLQNALDYIISEIEREGGSY